MTMLTAKLFEGKLRIIDSEKINEPKTKVLAKVIDGFANTKILFLGGYEIDPNFQLAHRNIHNISITKPDVKIYLKNYNFIIVLLSLIKFLVAYFFFLFKEINVTQLLKHDRLFITTNGLEKLEQLLIDKNMLLTRKFGRKNKEMLESVKERKILNNEYIEEEEVIYDPDKPLTFKYSIIEEYYQKYKEKKLEDQKKLEEIEEEGKQIKGRIRRKRKN